MPVPKDTAPLWPRRAAIAVALLHLAGARALEAQDARVGAAWQVGTYAGLAHRSPSNGALGTLPNRDHQILGLQAGTTILRLGALRVNYIAQLVPLLVITDRTAASYDSLLTVIGGAALPRRAYGVGIAPFGLEIATPLSRRVSGYVASAGGAVIFNRAFPDVTGRKANFSLEAGGGVRVRTRAAQWVQIGYKYHHLSNAGTAFANPGLDGNLFYAGYQWSARLPR